MEILPKIQEMIGKCAICLEEICNDISVLPCGHTYHLQCIQFDLQFYSRKCPICRNSTNPKEIIKILSSFTSEVAISGEINIEQNISPRTSKILSNLQITDSKAQILLKNTVDELNKSKGNINDLEAKNKELKESNLQLKAKFMQQEVDSGENAKISEREKNQTREWYESRLKSAKQKANYKKEQYIVQLESKKDIADRIANFYNKKYGELLKKVQRLESERAEYLGTEYITYKNQAPKSTHVPRETNLLPKEEPKKGNRNMGRKRKTAECGLWSRRDILMQGKRPKGDNEGLQSVLL